MDKSKRLLRDEIASKLQIEYADKITVVLVTPSDCSFIIRDFDSLDTSSAFDFALSLNETNLCKVVVVRPYRVHLLGFTGKRSYTSPFIYDNVIKTFSCDVPF